MASFHVQKSGTIRLNVTVNKKRYRVSTKFKAIKWDKEDQRVTGKGSSSINIELDRIEKEVTEWVSNTPTNLYSDEQIEGKLKSIVINSTNVSLRKPIAEYFNEFAQEKSTEINPKTKSSIRSSTIISYHRAFKYFIDTVNLELEQINKKNYHKFLAKMTDYRSVNGTANVVRRLKTFFIWCHRSELPINGEFKFWKPMIEDYEDDNTKALNSEQLRRIYELRVDPLDIYVLARELHDKQVNSVQAEALAENVEEARRQAVAIASMGPHKEAFWKLTDKNVVGQSIRYKREKNNQPCIAPAFDNEVFHALEYANLSGGRLFRRITKINYYLTYIKELCDLPFKVTAKTFRKTFGSIIWNEFDHPNKMGIIMKAYGHKNESVTRKYLGIQDEDLLRDHQELFIKKGL